MRRGVRAPRRRRRHRPTRGRAAAARGQVRAPGRAGLPPVDPILILSGPPGVGKTTVAKLLAGRFERSVSVGADVFFEFIQGGYVPPWEPESHAQNELVMDLAARTARDYVHAGYTTILEGIVLPKWFLEPVRATLAESGKPVAYAVIRAPLATCVERAAARERKPVEDAAVVETVWRQFADLGQFEPHALDVDGLAPGAIADELAAGLGGRFLLSP